MTEPAISVQHLSKKYIIGGNGHRYLTLRDAIAGSLKNPFQRILHHHSPPEIWALRDVSFEVETGEVIGVIGRNGAGKSTLLKILSRITPPTEGCAEIRGRVGSLLEVGTGFHPELTGRENIYLNGSILGMTRQEINERFDEIVKFSEIEKFLDTPVKHYSSGMYVRLAFAVAAHLEPEILLVDEVLAVGDAAFQKKCLGKLKNVKDSGKTVLFVSHNMGAISGLCRRTLLFESGRLVLNDDTPKVIDHYLNDKQALKQLGRLKDHPHHNPKLSTFLTKFQIEPDAGILQYGAPAIFKIGYQFPNTITGPQFCITFKNNLGIVVFTLVSDCQENIIPQSLTGSGEIHCRVHNIPLLPGKYFIDLALWHPGGELLDEIEDLACIQVEWLNRTFGQFNMDSTCGVVYVDATWEKYS